jgi:hypothetical protein
MLRPLVNRLDAAQKTWRRLDGHNQLPSSFKVSGSPTGLKFPPTRRPLNPEPVPPETLGRSPKFGDSSSPARSRLRKGKRNLSLKEPSKGQRRRHHWQESASEWHGILRLPAFQREWIRFWMTGFVPGPTGGSRICASSPTSAHSSPDCRRYPFDPRERLRLRRAHEKVLTSSDEEGAVSRKGK